MPIPVREANDEDYRRFEAMLAKLRAGRRDGLADGLTGLPGDASLWTCAALALAIDEILNAPVHEQDSIVDGMVAWFRQMHAQRLAHGYGAQRRM